MLPSQASYRLSLDRTNWKFGSTDINILMLRDCNETTYSFKLVFLLILFFEKLFK